jgi:DNA-directed RNA polymerase specialized sigma24 family protein
MDREQETRYGSSGPSGPAERAEGRPPDSRAESIAALLPRFTASGDWLGPGAQSAPAELLRCLPARIVRSCIDRLPEIYRVALLLRDVEGLSVPEAAAALGIPESALKMRHHRARQGLLTLLRAHVAALIH